MAGNIRTVCQSRNGGPEDNPSAEQDMWYTNGLYGMLLAIAVSRIAHSAGGQL